jgi:hypothetical protein
MRPLSQLLADAHGWCWGPGGWGPPVPFNPIGPGGVIPTLDPKKQACAEARANLASAKATQISKVGKLAAETAGFGAVGAGSVGCVVGILGITWVTDGLALVSPGAEVGACLGGGAGTVVAALPEIALATLIAGGIELIATQAEIDRLQKAANAACSR